MQQPQATGVSPLKVFGKMLKFYRNRSVLTSDQLGALVNLSGSAIRKVESGRQAPVESLVDALEAIPGLRCDGALRELFDQMSQYLTNGVFPGWFAGWPDPRPRQPTSAVDHHRRGCAAPWRPCSG